LSQANLIGKSERDRIGFISELPQEVLDRQHIRDGAADKGRGEKMIIINILLTVALIYMLVKSVLPLHAIFILGLPIALILNYEQSKHQGRIEAHARGAIYTSSIIFSAGLFTGILRGSGMITAMSEALVSLIPTAMGRVLPVITGVASMPLSLFFDPDSFYFGVLPVLSGAGEALGVSSLAMGRAAIMGQMTTGFPASPLTGATWLLIGLAGIELGDLQKALIPRAFITTLIMVFAALILGLI
jgi:CitMHS family citrate-Mg2+:H+ or citrate-Ca2+:H+ symporter